MDCSNQKIK